MTEQQIYNLRWKLPNLVYSFIKDGRKDEVMRSMGLGYATLVFLLEGEYFPSDENLKDFCNHFKLRYSTLKTWNVMHLL